MADISATTSASSVSSSIPEPNIKAVTIDTSYGGGNFTDPSCKVKNQYFNWSGSCYDNEKLMYKKLLNGAYNTHGVKCTYYPVDYNTNYDAIFGEDRDRTVARRFSVMVMFELPEQTRTFGEFGIDEIDNFKVFVSKSHFAATSKLNFVSDPSKGIMYDSYTPRVGDLLRVNYNNTLYEIIDVGEEEEMFLQTKHTWDLHLRVFRDDHLSLSADTSATMTSISGSIDQPDILDIKDDINTEKVDVIYSSANDDVAPNDPFAGW